MQGAIERGSQRRAIESSRRGKDGESSLHPLPYKTQHRRQDPCLSLLQPQLPSLTLRTRSTTIHPPDRPTSTMTFAVSEVLSCFVCLARCSALPLVKRTRLRNVLAHTPSVSSKPQVDDKVPCLAPSLPNLNPPPQCTDLPCSLAPSSLVLQRVPPPFLLPNNYLDRWSTSTLEATTATTGESTLTPFVVSSTFHFPFCPSTQGSLCLPPLTLPPLACDIMLSSRLLSLSCPAHRRSHLHHPILSSRQPSSSGCTTCTHMHFYTRSQLPVNVLPSIDTDD